MKQMLRGHISDVMNIRRRFPTFWLGRTPYLNPCDFWIWGYRKIIVYRNPIRPLSDLRKIIELCNFSMCQWYVHSIPTHYYNPFDWICTNQHAMLWIQMVAEKRVYHFEHVLFLIRWKNYVIDLYDLYKDIVHILLVLFRTKPFLR